MELLHKLFPPFMHGACRASGHICNGGKPPPRKANIFNDDELLSGAEIKERGVVQLFRDEPLLHGQCAALLLRDNGCDYPACPFCKRTLDELDSLDVRDLEAALRRAAAARQGAADAGIA